MVFNALLVPSVVLGLGAVFYALSRAARRTGTGPGDGAVARPVRWFTLAWATGRVLLLLLLLFVLRHPILSLIERLFDIIWITLFTIELASTPLSRLLFAAVLALILFTIGKASERLTGVKGYAAGLAAAGLALALIGELSGAGLKIALAIFVVLAINWAPMAVLERVGLRKPRLDALMVFAPAVSEGLFASRFLRWLGALLRGESAPPRLEIADKAPGAAITALILAVLVPAATLTPLERAMRSGPDVHMFATGDFNGLELDAQAAHLYVTGHGVPRLLRYDLGDLNAAPLESAPQTSGAQGLAYDAARNEVYVFNIQTREVLVLNGETLALSRKLPAPDLSPGDPWIALDPISDTVTLASEADQQIGKPFIVYDRASGKVLAKRAEEAGNLLVHPTKPLLYMSFFRRGQGVIAYNLATRQIAARGPTDERMDRLAFDRASSEVLVASPVEGRILRFDADTLKPKGAFPAIFGVRVLAIDTQRGVALAGSLATGKVAMIDMSTRRVTQTWYLGPWLRSIVVAPSRGVAYVSSQGNLYELRYARD